MKLSSISEPSLDEDAINKTPPSIESHIDIESANEALSGAKDWEHIHDFAKPTSLSGLGASITLIVSTPSNAAAHRILYTAYMAAAFNGLFAALVLAFYACRRRSGREVVRMLKSLMFLTLAFVAIACLIRLVFALPFQYLGVLCIFAVIILAIICLYITTDYKHRRDTDVVVGRS